MSLLDTASLVITPNGTKAGTLYSVVPSSGAGDMTVTRATTATRVNSAGLIESVASNVPRLDYSNGTCPSILVEPQRTNLVTWSEDLTNASWILENSTISANATVSPNGTTTADKVIASAVGGSKFTAQIINVSSGVVYTSTAYYKASEYTLAWMRLGGVANNPYVIYNLSTQAVVSTSGLISSSITPMGNGWYKVTATVTTTSNLLAPCLYLLPATGYTLAGDNIPQFTGNGSDGGFIWGAQLEAGSYATSYIPTTSASVTRNADVISKTGISSLIGQTEGVMYAEIDWVNNNTDAVFDTISDNTTNNRIHFGYAQSSNNWYLYIESGGSSQVNITLTAPANGRYKIAVGYKANDFVFYVNGVLIGSDTSGSVPSTSQLNLGGFITSGLQYSNRCTALWKTRLTNTQLASLTSL